MNDFSPRAASPERQPATILHIDMDSFFVSVELLDQPELRGKPIAVAHDSPRSVVSSASYEARPYGVSSAMPVAQAKRLCPQLVLVDPHMEKYRQASRAVMDIFREFTPYVEPISVDEAFLDVTGVTRLFGTPTEIAQHIRREVCTRTQLPASVGIGASKFIAKLASQRAKPDGVLEIPADKTLTFLHPLPISAIWGVGKATERALKSRAIHTVGELSRTPLASLTRIVGQAAAQKLHELANGIDPRTVEPERNEKSIGHEETFTYDEHDRDALERELLRLATKTAERLRDRGVLARTVSVKIRWAGFETITRARTLPEATQATQRIFRVAKELFQSADAGRAVRLIGVRAEGLQTGRAGDALWASDEEWDAVDSAVDRVRGKFGDLGITSARLLGEKAAPNRPSEHVPRQGE
jgi:DNA polymerase-4